VTQNWNLERRIIFLPARKKNKNSPALRFDINLFPVFAGSESDQSVILAIYVNSVRVEHPDENPGIASLPIMDIKGGRS